MFRVAASLDSMVVGEPQILGQVKEAYATARAVGAVREQLDQLVTPSVRSGEASAQRDGGRVFIGFDCLSSRRAGKENLRQPERQEVCIW